MIHNNIQALRNSVRVGIAQGNQLFAAGESLQAIRLLESVVKQARRFLFEGEEANALLSLAACLINNKTFDNAYDALLQAQRIAQELGDFQLMAKCDLNFGAIQRMKGDYPGAIDLFKTALENYTKAEDIEGIAQSHDNIGDAYSELGLIREAGHHIDVAGKLYRTLKSPYGYTINRMIAGHLYLEVFKNNLSPELEVDWLKEAHMAFDQAKQLASHYGFYAQYPRALMGLASVERVARNWEIAKLHLQEAISIYQASELPPPDEYLFALANVEIEMEDYGSARKRLEEVIALREVNGDQLKAANAFYTLGVIDIRDRCFEPAVNHLKQAIFKYQTIGQALGSQWFKTSFRSKIDVAFEHLQYAMFRFAEENREDKHYEALLHSLDRSKRQFTRNVSDRSSIDTAKELDLRWQFARIVKERTVLRTQKSKGSIDRESFGQRIDFAIKSGQKVFFELENLLRRITGIPPENHLEDFSMVERLQLLAKAMEKPVVIITIFEFFHFDSLGFIVLDEEGFDIRRIAIDGEARVELFQLVNETQFDGTVGSLVAKENKLSRISQALGRILQEAGIYTRLKKASCPYIYLNLQGLLNHFPWEISQFDNSVWGIEYSISRCMSLLADSEQTNLRKRKVAPPRFAMLASKNTLANAKEEERTILDRLQTQLDIVTLDPLQSKTSFVESVHMAQFDILHFLGHSVYEYADPELSRLVLNEERDEADQLTALEIASYIRLSNKPLIFLNSCESSQHSITNGDEFFGLMNSFFICGSGPVIGSNWQIIDTSAKEFAAWFYYYFIEKGEHSISAVRLARAEVARQCQEGDFKEYGKFVHFGPYSHVEPGIL